MALLKHKMDEYSPVSEINITPLVDVMLVLLVIFMVTAPMLESGITVQLPKASPLAIPKEDNPVTLSVTRDKRFYLEDSLLVPSDLTRSIQNRFKTKTKKELFIRADESLPYGFVAQTLTAVKLAGIQKIGLVTLPPEKKSRVK